jgi:hypothetical protein
MIKAWIIIIIVVAVLFGGLLTLRSTRNVGTPSGERLERAKQRAREQAERDKSEEDRR